MIHLRDYQQDLLARKRAAAATHRAVLVQLDTGGGKTAIMVHDAAETEGRALIVAHRRELIRQAHRAAVGHGLAATIYPSADPGRVQVGSIQTLARRLGDLPRFKRIIFDEAHHAIAKQYADLIDSQPEAEVVGYTATPERLDGRGLGERFGALVEGPTHEWLVANERLVPARVYGPPDGAAPNLSGVRTMAGDFNSADLEAAMVKPHLLGHAPAHYERLAAGRSCLVFCTSVRHAEESAAAFRMEGWRFRCVHGGMLERDRDAALLALAEGRLDGLTSCDLISEGLDIPDVGCVILQRPTQSLGMYRQMVGRGLRPAPGKRDCVVLDHAGNALRHGLPSMIRAWSLDAPKRKPGRTVLTCQCPSCFCVHTPAAVCPECGHDYRAEEAAAEARKLEQIEGELALLSASDRRLRELRETPLRDLLKAATTFDDLVEIGEARGFQRRWADVRSRFLPAPRVEAMGEEFAG